VFRIFFLIIAVAFVCAKDWVHYTKQNDVRDVILIENGTLWAAFAWGLQERLANKRENNYMPGSNNLQAADFVQLFALPGEDIIAVSKNGILVRKNKNSQNFEIINNAFAEKKRNLLEGLGKRAENILVLPFEGAIAFFDYEQNRSVITIEMPEIKRVAVRNDSIWLDLGTEVLVRKTDWKKIYDDRFLADPSSWKKTNGIPFEEVAKHSYVPNNLNFPLEKVRTIAISSNGDAIAWGNEYNYLSRMQHDRWGEAFWQDIYDNDQKNYSTKSLAMLKDGSFAMGMFGGGVSVFNANFPIPERTGYYHSQTTNNTCPSEWKENFYNGWTIVQGLVPAPNDLGYIFSYISENKYGLGYVNKDGGKPICEKHSNASSNTALAIISRQSETGDLEIYVAWQYSLESKTGGIDFYLTPQDNFSPTHQKKWTLNFESPIDFAFDSKGVLWAVSSSKIFYLDKSDDEWKEPSYIRGFGGGTISGLATDAQNGLWISTLDYGAYSFSQKTPDTLMAKQYKIKDGLLNETVYDIAIDTIRGKVYFAHDLGLSVYSTQLVRNATGYMQGDAQKPIAYPNPFRPKEHGSVRIDYVSEKSSLYILDSSGKRVMLFKGTDLRGGAVVWDGKNENGKLVAPGLYYYVAADGKNTAKGKILVER